jgi:hypothetical protein
MMDEHVHRQFINGKDLSCLDDMVPTIIRKLISWGYLPPDATLATQDEVMRFRDAFAEALPRLLDAIPGLRERITE